MYRIAVCDDEPLMAEENVNMARRILNGRGMDPERDYLIDAYLSPDPLMEKLTEGTNGRCVMEPGEQVWYGLQGKEIVFL